MAQRNAASSAVIKQSKVTASLRALRRARKRLCDIQDSRLSDDCEVLALRQEEADIVVETVLKSSDSSSSDDEGARKLVRSCTLHLAIELAGIERSSRVDLGRDQGRLIFKYLIGVGKSATQAEQDHFLLTCACPLIALNLWSSF
jgi:hypothetical protein